LTGNGEVLLRRAPSDEVSEEVSSAWLRRGSELSWRRERGHAGLFLVDGGGTGLMIQPLVSLFESM
jgi:hypothetical protein